MPRGSLLPSDYRIRKPTLFDSAGRPGGRATTRRRYGPRASRPPRGPAPGEPERVAAGQHVSQPGEQAEPLPPRQSSTSRLRERAELAAAGAVAHLPGLNGEHGRRAVGRAEALRRERDAAEQRRALWPEGDRPRHDDAAAAGHVEPRPPSIAPSLRGRNEHARRERDDALRAGREADSRRPGDDRDARDSLDRGCHVDRDAPRGDVADDDPANRFQPGSSAAPKPTAAGSAITSAALAAAASTTPAPWRPSALEPRSAPPCRRERPSAPAASSPGGPARAPRQLRPRPQPPRSSR